MVEITREAREMGERVKGYIIAILNGFDANDIVAMIVNDDMPILVEQTLPPIFMGVIPLVTKYREKLLELCTMDKVMLYCSQFRADLLPILQNARGYKWMDNFMKQVRFLIENADMNPYELQQEFYRRIEVNKQKRMEEELKVQKEFLKAQFMEEEKKKAILEARQKQIEEERLKEIDRKKAERKEKINQLKEKGRGIYKRILAENKKFNDKIEATKKERLEQIITEQELETVKLRGVEELKKKRRETIEGLHDKTKEIMKTIKGYGNELINSSPSGSEQPETLEEALTLPVEDLDMEKVDQLLEEMNLLETTKPASTASTSETSITPSTEPYSEEPSRSYETIETSLNPFSTDGDQDEDHSLDFLL